MRRLLPALLLMLVLGCHGADEIVAPSMQTPTPAPTYEIHGTVTYNGRPMHATVIATSARREIARVTSSPVTGFYQITGLPAGEIQLTARSEYCGFIPLTVTVPVSGPIDLHLLQC